MTKTPLKFDAGSFRRLAGRRKQTGELSLIEAAGVMAAAAVISLVVYMGRQFVMDRIHAYEFGHEVQLFRSGIENATASDTDMSGETLQSLAQNHAFDSAGTRVDVNAGTIRAIFGGAVTEAPGTVTNTDDAVVITYPVPAKVCSLAAATVVSTYTEVQVNGTTIVGPNTTFNDTTAGTACASAGATASIAMYATRDN
jgi:hypothetical protein